jgi:hypothetical protein
LNAANQFIFFAGSELKIVVGEPGPFLFYFALGNIPITFDFKFIYKFGLFLGTIDSRH